jgi:hypothetical protein
MSKKIAKLTKEQEEMIPKYLETYLSIGLSTEPCDRAKAEAAITEIYAIKGLKKPEFIWADSPFQGTVLAAQVLKGDSKVTSKEVQEQASKASYGSFEAYWVSFYAFISEQLPVETHPLMSPVIEVVKNCGLYWTFEDLVILTEKPVEIHMKDKKLHNPDGLALKYRNGDGIFAVNGTVYKSMLDMAVEQAALQQE